MKKFGLMLFSMMLMLISVGLFACNDDTNKEIKSVAAQGLANSYQVTDTIPFESTKIVVTYDNDQTATLTKGKIDGTLADLKAENSDLEFVLLTGGLASQTAGEYELGDYQISCYVAGSDQKFDLFKIKIYFDEAETYDLELFNAPSLVKTFSDRMEEAGKGMGENNENSFVKKAESYVVGDDNEFVFEPIVTLSAKDDPSTLVKKHKIEVNVQVHEIDGDSQTEVGSEIYTFNPETYGFQFTEAADGNTYQITMSPKNWTEDVDGNVITPVKFTFMVEDGWNADDELDLGRLNLVDENNKAAVNGFGTYASSVRNVFYLEKSDGQGGTNYEYGNIKYYELWENFLKGQGEEDLREIKALYLHKDMQLTTDVIPQEYIVGGKFPGGEKEAIGNDFAAGSLRDFTFLYNHMMTSDFVLNGNLFNIDVSKMPVNKSDAKNEEGSHLQLLTSGDTVKTGGHSTTFAFVHKVDSKFVATIKNISAQGNMKLTEDDEKHYAQDASRALMFVKSLYGVCKADNTISKEFMIAWYPESEISAKCLELSNSKVYDCAQCGVFAYHSTQNQLTNCELKRFGGPAIFLIGHSDDYSKRISAGGVVVDDKSVVESWVNGEEAWLSLNGGNILVETIRTSFDKALTPLGTTISQMKEGPDAEQIEKINLQVLCLDTNYLDSTKESIFDSYKYGDWEFATDDKTVEDLRKIREVFSGKEPPILKFADGSYKILIENDNAQIGTMLIDSTKVPDLLALKDKMQEPNFMDQLGLALMGARFTDKLSGDKVGVHYRDGQCCIGFVVGLYPVAA